MTEPEGAWGRCLIAAAGLLGLAGVALGAAGAHLGGGDLVRLASAFALFHAAALPGLLALRSVGRGVGRRRVAWAATCLAAGAALFSGDVAWLGFTGHTPVSGVAPAGGLLMMIGWLLVAICAVPTLRGPSPDT